VRERAARAVQAVFRDLGLPAVTDAEVEAAIVAHGSGDMPDRDRAADVEAADELLARGVSALDVALALDRHGFEDVAPVVAAEESLLFSLPSEIRRDLKAAGLSDKMRHDASFEEAGALH